MAFKIFAHNVITGKSQFKSKKAFKMNNIFDVFFCIFCPTKYEFKRHQTVPCEQKFGYEQQICYPEKCFGIWRAILLDLMKELKDKFLLLILNFNSFSTSNKMVEFL